MSRLVVPFLEAATDVGQRNSLFVEQNEQMVDEIGRFVERCIAVIHNCREREFHAFFAEFLSKPLAACGDELRSIAFYPRRTDAILHDSLELLEKV